jgi:hypothetical protein
MKMKIALPVTTLLAVFLHKVSAEQSGIFAANGVELEMYQFGEDIIYGEPVSTQSQRVIREKADPPKQSMIEVSIHTSILISRNNSNMIPRPEVLSPEMLTSAPIVWATMEVVWLAKAIAMRQTDADSVVDVRSSRHAARTPRKKVVFATSDWRFKFSRFKSISWQADVYDTGLNVVKQ